MANPKGTFKNGKEAQKTLETTFTEVTGFKPNKQQLAWLKSALDPTVQPTIKAIAADCGVNRENWYKWLRNPKFVEWFSSAWKKGMERTEWFFDKVGMVQATKDYRYFEAMQMKYHKFKKFEEDPASQIQRITVEFVNAHDNKDASNKRSSKNTGGS
jgi:hypothetical protein